MRGVFAAGALIAVAATGGWTVSYSFGKSTDIETASFAARFGSSDDFGVTQSVQSAFARNVIESARKYSTSANARVHDAFTASRGAIRALVPSVPVSAPAVAPKHVLMDKVALFDPVASMGESADTFSRPIVVASIDPAPLLREAEVGAPQDIAKPPTIKQLVQSIPLPHARPAAERLAKTRDADTRNLVQRARAALMASASTREQSLLEKLFGAPSRGPMLAYAAPNGGVASDGTDLQISPSSELDRYTAVYDITAKQVYMPDGSKLEAHSGLGAKMDDPRNVHIRMHGATPPHVYDLKLRESLFHGVQAIRLTPLGGEGAIFGRTGLLAHTYMLGPRGDSNGCVSFKNYDAFLRAFQRGEVKRLVVVASLG